MIKQSTTTQGTNNKKAGGSAIIACLGAWREGGEGCMCGRHFISIKDDGVSKGKKGKPTLR